MNHVVLMRDPADKLCNILSNQAGQSPRGFCCNEGGAATELHPSMAGKYEPVLVTAFGLTSLLR